MTDDLEKSVHGASRGDVEALEQLLARFLPDVERYVDREAGRLVRAKESAEDIAQSVCREVLERLGDERIEYRGEAAFKSWLMQAAVHKLQNRHRFYRADRRDAAREAQPDDTEARAPALGDLIHTLSTPSRAAMRHEDMGVLQAALEQLPAEHRRVIELTKFEGLSHREVAEQLGVTENHSRVLLARAMARLARIAGSSD